MNFADALRELNGPFMDRPAPTRPTLRVVESEAAVVTSHAPAVADTHPVRLELSLTPEQLQSLLRVVGQKPPAVLTLREASHMLRVPASSLVAMAVARQIPAFSIDGKWRFGRAVLEEWLRESHIGFETPAREAA